MGHGSPRETLRETAAAWHDRLHRDKVPDETRRLFADWLAESPQHRAAYEAIDQTWSHLQSAAQDPQMLELRHETALRLTRRTSDSVRPLRWAAAAVLLIAVGSAAVTLLPRSFADRSLITWLLEPFQSHGDGRYATATGERLGVTL